MVNPFESLKITLFPLVANDTDLVKAEVNNESWLFKQKFPGVA